MTANVPQPLHIHAHHWMILLDRYVCKARTPECWRCAVVPECAFKAKALEVAVKKAGGGRKIIA